MKMLRKSSDGVLFGVCGGLAEYANLDPTIVRLIVAGLALFNPTTVLVYLIAALIMPND